MLTDDSYLVPVPNEDTPFAMAQRLMARWSNGADHTRRRAIAVAALSSIDTGALRRRASEVMNTELDAVCVEFDLMPIARFVPVLVLAEALGLPDPRGAAADLERVVAATLNETAANVVSLLLQCQVSTAAWIAADLLGTAPPFLHTVRVRDGLQFEVSLSETPFGAGSHECPGREHALALAKGVLAPVSARSLRPMDPVHVVYEDRPNVRLPAFLMVSTADERRAGQRTDQPRLVSVYGNAIGPVSADVHTAKVCWLLAPLLANCRNSKR